MARCCGGGSGSGEPGPPGEPGADGADGADGETLPYPIRFVPSQNSTTLDSGDANGWVFLNPDGAPVTCPLPAPGSVGVGKTITLICLSAGGAEITGTFNGTQTDVVLSAGAGLVLLDEGTSWWAIAVQAPV